MNLVQVVVYDQQILVNLEKKNPLKCLSSLHCVLGKMSIKGKFGKRKTPKIVLQISILLQPKLAPSQKPQDSKMELHVQATLMGSTIDLNAFLVASCTLHDSHRLLN